MKKLFTKKQNSNKSATSKKLPFKYAIALLIIAAIGLFGASGYYWYKQVLMNPDRALTDMLDKSLQVTAVDKTISQSSQQAKINQSIHVGFSPTIVTQSVTNLEQSSSEAITSVVTETVGTKDTDLVRYTSIDVSGPNAPKQDYKNILNVWGKRQSDEKTGQSVSFLNDALFAVVPFGNLNPSQRKEVKEEIKKVNLYGNAQAKTEFVNGRPVINYAFDLDPQALVQVLAKYAKVTGVGNSTELDPASYEGAAKILIKLQIDALSRHVNTVEFADSGRTETYVSYNSLRQVPLATETISIDELQNRLSKLESQGN